MLYEDLAQEMKTAAVCYSATASKPMDLWGISLTSILKKVMAKALDLGREHRHEIEQAAKSAIDALVALDLPYIPDGIEGTIDEATRDLGYRAVEAILNAILAE